MNIFLEGLSSRISILWISAHSFLSNCWSHRQLSEIRNNWGFSNDFEKSNASMEASKAKLFKLEFLQNKASKNLKSIIAHSKSTGLILNTFKMIHLVTQSLQPELRAKGPLPPLIEYLSSCNSVICKETMHTAKTQYLKCETNIPRKEIARPQSQFPQSCVCDRSIYYHNRSAYSTAGKHVDWSWEYIKSRTDTWMWKLKLRPPNSFSLKYINGIFDAVQFISVSREGWEDGRGEELAALPVQQADPHPAHPLPHHSGPTLQIHFRQNVNQWHFSVGFHIVVTHVCRV
jgi:hypothetical protein